MSSPLESKVNHPIAGASPLMPCEPFDVLERNNDLSSLSPKRRRVSHFLEMGIDDYTPKPSSNKRPSRHVRFQSKSNVFEAPNFDREKAPEEEDWPLSSRSIPDYSVPLKEPLEPFEGASQCRPHPRTSPARLIAFTIFFASLLALLHNSPLIGFPSFSKFGAKGGVVKGRAGPIREEVVQEKRELVERQNNVTNYCKRWSQQSAMVNGTIYLYGGRMTTDDTQNSHEWNNDFLYLDATKSWQIASPVLGGLAQPSGPPAVANGYLWHSYTSLFLYGGEYEENPATSPSPLAIWEYDIPSKTWNSHSSPSTSPGNNSDGGNQPLQDSAEGAGVSIPSLGRGYFFGGHQDEFTTVGWSYQIGRIYLKSLLEFTFPGYTNNGVKGLATTPAGSAGAFRNITTGGNQGGNGFSERADGALVYVPGFGQQGLVLGLAGGNNQSFQEMNIIDVYDIAQSQWYQQTTSGGYPNMRVNPCVVAASAPDGSSTNVYMFGGQNLQPYDNQTQYNDMWILSVPSFNWIQVDQSGQSVPPGRSGHSCEIWDGQMIVMGGYVGSEISCESPGIFVFDMTNLKWQNDFASLSGGDPQNQQPSQANSPNALAGSYGYQVPAAVQSVIGGASSGGATETAPVATATAGPLATGTAIIYTATGPAGTIVTETAGPGSVVVPAGSVNQKSGPNIAAIVAGTIAGVLFVVACYLAFCTWVYRRQLQLYKNHVAAAQRAAAAPPNEKTGFLGTGLGTSAGRSSDDPRSSTSRRSMDAS
ncbi:MAG: hypothetical protein LQ340_005619, partial [Diploschistes diacapsis]